MTASGTKIVVGIDFSAESERAAREALAVARHLGATLVLVHVCDTAELPVDGRAGRPARPGGGREDPGARGGRGRARPRSARRPARAGSRARGSMSPGCSWITGPTAVCPPPQGSSAPAWSWSAPTAGPACAGSSSAASRSGWCADARPTSSWSAPSTRPGHRRSLVATDFSDGADRLLERAVALAPAGTRIDVLHVVDAGDMMGMGGCRTGAEAALWDALTADLRARGEALASRHARPDLEIAFHLAAERPAPAIIAWLETHGHDLAVLGTHRRKGLRAGSSAAWRRRSYVTRPARCWSCTGAVSRPAEATRSPDAARRSRRAAAPAARRSPPTQTLHRTAGQTAP